MKAIQKLGRKPVGKNGAALSDRPYCDGVQNYEHATSKIRFDADASEPATKMDLQMAHFESEWQDFYQAYEEEKALTLSKRQEYEQQIRDRKTISQERWELREIEELKGAANNSAKSYSESHTASKSGSLALENDYEAMATHALHLEVERLKKENQRLQDAWTNYDASVAVEVENLQLKFKEQLEELRNQKMDEQDRSPGYEKTKLLDDGTSAQEALERMQARAETAEQATAKYVLDTQGVQLGGRCVVQGYTCEGVVRFVGVHFGDVRIGVELDKPQGDSDGTYYGQTYFHCARFCGVLVAPGHVSPVNGASQSPRSAPKSPSPRTTAKQVSPAALVPIMGRMKSEKERKQKSKTMEQFKSVEKLRSHVMAAEIAKEMKHQVSEPFGKTLSESPQHCNVEVGDRCAVQGYSCGGVVKFVGPHHVKGNLKVGVEMDEQLGKSDGVFFGHRYFTCKPDHGVFVVPSKVSKIDGSGVNFSSLEMGVSVENDPGSFPFGKSASSPGNDRDDPI